MSDGTLTFDTALDLSNFLSTLSSLASSLASPLAAALAPLSQTYTPTLSARDLASPVVSRVAAALSALDGRSVTVSIRAVSASASSFAVPLATGMSFVPADHFPALLHRGEAVLTRAQADLWRAGTPSAPAAFHQTNHFHLPVQTPDEFAKTMQLYATYGLEGVI